MDENQSPDLDELIETANYRAVLENQKQLLKSKFSMNSTFSFNGGTFNVTPELITYVRLMLEDGEEQLILLDKHSRPILVENLQEFYDEIKVVYQDAISDYFFSHKKIAKARRKTSRLLEV